MDKQSILARLRAFVDENFLYMRPDFTLGDDDSLMGNGIVDSMGAMEMIEFVESEFGVVVEDHHITEEHIGTLNLIAAYIAARTGSSQPA
ncbi:MAG TPA: acyl carrier protein [Longimicrobiales bacterium]